MISPTTDKKFRHRKILFNDMYMMSFFLSFFLFFIIVVAFVFGISLGYWAVCGILYFFSPDRTQKKPTQTPTFAHSPSSN